jgi:hypothetical protein
MDNGGQGGGCRHALCCYDMRASLLGKEARESRSPSIMLECLGIWWLLSLRDTS